MHIQIYISRKDKTTNNLGWREYLLGHPHLNQMFLSQGVDSSNKTLQIAVKLVWTKYKSGWLGIAAS